MIAVAKKKRQSIRLAKKILDSTPLRPVPAMVLGKRGTLTKTVDSSNFPSSSSTAEPALSPGKIGIQVKGNKSTRPSYLDLVIRCN